MVEFWGAFSKIKVKLKVTRNGIPRKEKYFIMILFGLEEIVLGALDHYASKNVCSWFKGARFLIQGLVLLTISIRALFFSRSIIKDIMEMKESSNSNKKARVTWQLKFKFGIFFFIAFVFVAFMFYNGIQILADPTKGCMSLMSDWSFRYEVPIMQIMFLLAAYTLLFQFSDTSAVRCGSKKQTSTNKVSDVKNDENISRPISRKSPEYVLDVPKSLHLVSAVADNNKNATNSSLTKDATLVNVAL